MLGIHPYQQKSILRHPLVFLFVCLATLSCNPSGKSAMTGPKPDPLAVLATDAEMASWAGRREGVEDDEDDDGMAEWRVQKTITSLGMRMFFLNLVFTIIIYYYYYYYYSFYGYRSIIYNLYIYSAQTL